MGSFDDLIPGGAFDDLVPKGKKTLSDIPSMAWEDVKRVGGNLYNAITGLPSLPQRAIEASDVAVHGGEYNPGPALEAATLATPLSVAARAGEAMIPGVASNLAKVEPKVPTASDLKLAGATDIKAAVSSPLAATPESAAAWSSRAQQRLFERGIHPTDAPATFKKLQDLENGPTDASFTASNMQSFRRSLGKTAQNFNPQASSDQLAASLAIKDFDTFIPSLTEADVLAGTPATTQALFERGRGNYAAAQRSNAITGELDRATTGILERAQGRAQAANSGRNLDNTIRSRVESVLERPKAISGLSDAEVSALNDVVQGSQTRNFARYLSNLFGGGGGAGQSLIAALGAGGGGVAGGIPGAIIGAAVPATTGAVSRQIANTLAKKSLQSADELIRKRSPLYKQALQQAESYAPGIEKRAALARLLLLGNFSEQQ